MEVIILMGLQGAGKTRFFYNRFATTHQHISRDNFPNASRPEKRQLGLLEEALQRGESVVLDNTNATVAVRAPLIELAHSYPATVIGYYFQSQIKSCLERNAAREGKARVPDVAIYATSARMEQPTYGEGFDQLFYVRLADDGTYKVLKWQDEGEINSDEVTNNEQRPL